jgi:fatty acid kinase fatty acid binding subunit
MGVRLVTDSTAYLPETLTEALDIGVVQLFVNEGTASVPEREVDLDAFYRRLAEIDHLPSTAQASVDELAEAFRQRVRGGDDALGIFISEAMSGTVQAARIAAGIVAAEGHVRRVEVLDSRSNCMQMGLAVLAAATAARDGGSLAACVEAAQQSMRRSRYLFTPASLEYLRRGGRIGGASALIGQLLQVRPILTVEAGETQVFARVRTTAKALATIAEAFSADIEAKGLRSVYCHAIADRETAERFAAEQIEPIAGRAVEVILVGPAIGLHVGPAVGLVYETEEPLRD